VPRYRLTIRDTDHFDDEDGVFLLDDGAAREYAIQIMDELQKDDEAGWIDHTFEVMREGRVVWPSQAVTIGLIVTELVINAIKHAFPADQADGTVVVAYDLAAPNWTLSVCMTNPKERFRDGQKANPG
jgi:two-component sensor histidine kinase